MKIFYSWQSDISADRNYIARRLEQAVSKLDGWEIETATRNTPGAPDIAATILAKIDECDLFLADVGIINPGATPRECPNPNVMYELGYAVAAKGQANIILIANKATTNTANLPFDIRNRRMILKQFNDANKAATTSELVGIMQSHQPAQPVDVPKFELLDNEYGWANWSGAGVRSGFRYNIRIDNFGGEIDFIDDIRVTTKDAHGDPWATTYYAFDGHKPNEKLKIQKDEIEEVGVFLTDQPGESQRMFPDLDRDIVSMVITLRSDGRKIELPIPASHLVHR